MKTLAVLSLRLTGGLDDGAAVAFASDAPPPGVAAPLASEPLPPLPADAPCPA
jgi:hypothetical protein